VVQETPNMTATSVSVNDSSLNSSTASEWFNNTHDEMVLYEKYGEDYDQVSSKLHFCFHQGDKDKDTNTRSGIPAVQASRRFFCKI
jgi:hypothetical protein